MKSTHYLKLILLTLSLSGIWTTSRAQNFAWAKNVGGTGWDDGISIATDAAGNVYTTGYFNDVADFDPGPGTMNLTSVGNEDVFVAKYDPLGNLLWAKRMGGASTEWPKSIAVDDLGNVYTTGFFSGSADFDPGPSVANLTASGFNDDIFISKLDASGNYVWAKSVGGTEGDRGLSIKVDASGNVYNAGYFDGTVDFDPGAGTYNLTGGYGDGYILKLDASGGFLWARSIGNPNFNDMIASIALDGSGDVYATGSFSDVVDFDPGAATYNLTSAGGSDVFVLKLDAGGNFVWAQNMGGTSYENGSCISVDGLGNVYTTGGYVGTADFDPGPGVFNLTGASPMDFNIFISKLDGSGNFVWADGIGGPSFDNGTAITTDATGNAYITGSYQGTADFDPGPGNFDLISNGSQDIYIAKYNDVGTLVWANSIGGADGEQGFSIAVNSGGDIYVTGPFLGPADFDPGTGVTTLTSAGGDDAFILKLGGCGSTTALTQTSCDSLVLNGQTYYTTGVYTQNYTNMAGCDSIVTLDLTITNSTGSTLTQTSCDSFVLNGTTYLTSGTYTQMLTNAAGCDSTLTLDLTINTTAAATITQAGNVLTASAGNSYQWLNCGSSNIPITGATSQSYTAITAGSYSVVVTSAGGCSDTADCVTITAVPTNGFSDLVHVYPNPAGSKVIVSIAQPLHNGILKLVNMVGQVMTEQTDINGNSFSLNVADYAPGVYFIEISENNRSARIKLIKE